MSSPHPTTSAMNNPLQTWKQPRNLDPNLNPNDEEESEKILKTDPFGKPLYKEEFVETSKENYIGPTIFDSKSISDNSNSQGTSGLRAVLEEIKSIQVDNNPIKSYETPDKRLRGKVFAIIDNKSYTGKDREAWEDLCAIEPNIKEQFPKLSIEDKFDLSITIAAINGLGQRNDAVDEALKQAEELHHHFVPKNHCELFARMWHLRGDLEGRKGNLDKVLEPLDMAKNLFGCFGTDKEGQDALYDAKAWNHTNRGQYWLKMGDFKRAEYHYNQALDLRKKLKDMRLISLALCNLANLYAEWGNLDEADLCAKSCMACIDKFNKDFYLKGKLLCIQAKICHKKNMRPEAVGLHQQGLEILKARLAPDNDLSREYGKIEY